MLAAVRRRAPSPGAHTRAPGRRDHPGDQGDSPLSEPLTASRAASASRAATAALSAKERMRQSWATHARANLPRRLGVGRRAFGTVAPCLHHRRRRDRLVPSGATLRRCVEPLLAMDRVRTTVVDNASPDDTLDTISDLPVEVYPGRGVRAGSRMGATSARLAGAAPLLILRQPRRQTIHHAALAAILGAPGHARERDPVASMVALRISSPPAFVANSRRRSPLPWGLRDVQACFLQLPGRAERVLDGTSSFWV